MKKYLCIHGHFYQPPRENPWLEAVELQDSAYPYHDWNERVTAECYAPNATARLLGAEGRIAAIVNNYARMSFDFGPTLLHWLQSAAPDIHAAIVAADQQSCERFSGHGAALAMAYNHLILPLAHPRDKQTQILWGLRDFQHRFGRPAEGLWLPETAADLATLECLADHGLQYTLLSPFQARRVRRLNRGHWRDVQGGRIDPSRAYRVHLPSGRALAVFFYDAPIAQAVAFEGLLDDGGRFAQRLLEGFDDQRDWDQLMHIATDGESYGHHHRYGEMALAYALHDLERNAHVELTTYGEFLERHPPTHEVEIHSRSAWSCPHGVERWNSHCGCNSGRRPGWNQHWRLPLRTALDWLRDQLAPAYESEALTLFHDPWQARDDYISILLDRSPESLRAFFERQAKGVPSADDQVRALRLLELQRHALLMYTSCGWFFDELSGPETVQIIQYAARAIQLAQTTLGRDFEPGFLDRLAAAKSNLQEHEDGRRIYEKFVQPAITDHKKVGAHYAISSLFESYPPTARIYAFTVEQQDRQVLTAGQARLALGRARITYEITRHTDLITYGVLHLGDHNLNCGVRHYQGPDAYATLLDELRAAFEQADFPQVIRIMDRHFGESHYALKTLFRDEQRRILDEILAATFEDIHNTYRQITDRYTPLLRFLGELRAPAPRALRGAVEFVLNAELRKQCQNEIMDLERMRALLAQCERDKVTLDVETLAYALKGHLDRLSEQCLRTPDDLARLERFTAVAALVRNLPFETNLWKPQNLYYRMFQSVYPAQRARQAQADPAAQAWITQFLALGEQLGFEPPRTED